MQNFLSIADFDRAGLLEVLEIAATQKRKVFSQLLLNQNLALLFEKPSLRTKASFEVGVRELGGATSFFGPGECGVLGERESIQDFAQVISNYYDAVVARVYSHVALEKFALSSNVPVINALSDREHPCQILADLLTIREYLGRVENFKLAFLGDGNNVALSLALAAEILNFKFTLAGPQSYFLPYPQIEQTENLAAALTNADVVYTDTWISMGAEAAASERERAFSAYQLNAAALRQANSGALVLHCLPAHRGQEITDEVLDGPQSVVIRQAANRLPAQKALLIKLLQWVWSFPLACFFLAGSSE